MLHRLVPLLVAAVAAAAAEPAPAPVILASEDADWQATVRQLQASPYGKLWRDPRLDRARARLAEVVRERLGDTGIGIDEVLADAAEMRTDLTVTADGVVDRFAVRLPATAERVIAALDRLPPAVVEDMSGAFRRIGDWVVYGSQPPGAEPVAAGAAPGASRTVIDLTALRALPDAADAVGVLGQLGLERIEWRSSFTAEGSRDSGSIAGPHPLPLAPLDPAALAVFPRESLSVTAIGLDGKALADAIVRAAEGSPAIGEAVGGIRRAATDAGLGDVDALLRASSGTVALAVTPGVPFPGCSLLVPASPELDRLAETLAGRVGLDLAPAREGAVVLPLPPQIPTLVQLRRLASHWLVSTDQAVIDRASAPGPGGFDLGVLAAGLVEGDGRPTAIAYQDNAAQVRILHAMLGMALAATRQEAARRRGGPGASDQDLQLGLAALLVVADHVPPTTSVLVADGARTRFEGRNAIMQVFSAGVVAGMAIPGIAMTRQAALRAKSGARIRQLGLGCLVWANENEGRWPTDLAEMRGAAGDASGEELLRSSSPPHREYLYVRPDPMATPDQPVLLEDPACNGGKGGMVCYGDGHVDFVKGTALWNEARRLAASPHAATAGIARAEWTTVPAAADDDEPDLP